MTMAPAVLTRQTNQALGLGRYAISFIEAGEPSQAVIERTSMFVTDATFCGLSAIALKTNAPTVLRQQALDSRPNRFTLGNVTQEGVTIFGSTELVCPLEATLADCNAVREWDSNGTNFGYDPVRGNTAGEFGHNDFYPAIFNAAQMCGCDGATLMRALICVDTIRGRLAEVFSLKTYKIDHVLHGGIATAAVVGALLGATAEQIESAIGYTVAHHVPFRAIRAGKDLSDSKGASAAITATAAFKGVLLSMRGFNGPRDIFRNPEAIFRLFEGPGQMLAPIDTDGTLKLPPNVERLDESPFDLEMPMAGDDFPIMGMHIKLALYEHQSAGAVHAVISLLEQNPSLLEGGLDRIKEILILAYEPAFGIIGDPAKMTPGTRQSADHSMPYIVGTLIRKALKQKGASWLSLMLEPMDYHRDVLEHPATRALMTTSTPKASQRV